MNYPINENRGLRENNDFTYQACILMLKSRNYNSLVLEIAKWKSFHVYVFIYEQLTDEESKRNLINLNIQHTHGLNYLKCILE